MRLKRIKTVLQTIKKHVIMNRFNVDHEMYDFVDTLCYWYDTEDFQSLKSAYNDLKENERKFFLCHIALTYQRKDIYNIMDIIF